MKTRVIDFGSQRHGCWRKILHLFQFKVQLLRLNSQIGHILVVTTRVTGDKIRNQLLIQSCFPVYPLELLLELSEISKRRFAHQIQHRIRRMFGRHLQPSGNMVRNQLANIFNMTFIKLIVFGVAQQHIVAHTTTDKRFLDARHFIHRPVNVQQRIMIGIEIKAYLREYTRRLTALSADVLLDTLHAVHICRWATQVA